MKFTPNKYILYVQNHTKLLTILTSFVILHLSKAISQAISTNDKIEIVSETNTIVIRKFGFIRLNSGKFRG